MSIRIVRRAGARAGLIRSSSPLSSLSVCLSSPRHSLVSIRSSAAAERSAGLRTGTVGKFLHRTGPYRIPDLDYSMHFSMYCSAVLHHCARYRYRSVGARCGSAGLGGCQLLARPLGGGGGGGRAGGLASRAAGFCLGG
eukprot:COSAG02_NODE_24014_length_700_cov_4.707155_1_plen_138_part_10